MSGHARLFVLILASQAMVDLSSGLWIRYQGCVRYDSEQHNYDSHLAILYVNRAEVDEPLNRLCSGRCLNETAEQPHLKLEYVLIHMPERLDKAVCACASKRTLALAEFAGDGQCNVPCPLDDTATCGDGRGHLSLYQFSLNGSSLPVPLLTLLLFLLPTSLLVFLN